MNSTRALQARGIDTTNSVRRRRRRLLHQRRAGLRGRARHRRQWQEGRRQQPRHRGARRARHDGRALARKTPVSAFVAVEEAGDLPQHAAMVRLHGPRHRGAKLAIPCVTAPCTPSTLTKFYPPTGQNRLRSMIAERPDWVLSRQRAWGVADRGVRQQGHRRDPQGRGGEPPHHPGVRGRGRRCLVQARRRGALSRLGLRSGAVGKDRRHPRRLVRERHDACLGAAQQAGMAVAQLPGLDVSGRLRPASRLVPFLAARKLRHQWLPRPMRPS